MHKGKLIRFVASTIAIAGVLGIVSGSVFGGVFASRSASGSLKLAGTGVRISTYSVGSKYGAFIQRDSAGNVCLLSGQLSSSERVGGCNPAVSPLDGRAMLTLYNFEGGPVITSVTDARVAGLADPSVRRVELVLTDGTHRRLLLAVSPGWFNSRGRAALQASTTPGRGSNVVPLGPLIHPRARLAVTLVAARAPSCRGFRRGGAMLIRGGCKGPPAATREPLSPSGARGVRIPPPLPSARR